MTSSNGERPSEEVFFYLICTGFSTKNNR